MLDHDAVSRETEYLDDVTAERLNSEPMILRGCTSSELLMLVAIAVVFWIPLSILVAWWLNALPMAMGMAGIGVLVTVVVMATVFQRVKRGRPDGYYQQYIAIWLHRKRWWRSPYCLPDGLMRIGRTRGRR